LFDCAESGYSLGKKGVTLETKMVDLANGEHLTDAFGKINPHRTVPVLELDDGTCFLDTFSICIYLEGIFPEPNLMGRDAKERAVIAMWQRDMDLNGQNAIAKCFRNISRGFRGRAMTGPVDYEQIPELAERGRQRVRQFFRDLDRRFANSEYVAGDRFTIADITALVAVDFVTATVWASVTSSQLLFDVRNAAACHCNKNGRCQIFSLGNSAISSQSNSPSVT
jgi:glutathione S-transferase